MQIERTEQVGKVVLKQIKVDHTALPAYSDGPVEDELYQTFKSNSDHETIAENNKFASWAHEYHLSPVRHNLLKWYPFNPDGSVLEVGAGCGALTGLLCDKLKKVTALEYSQKRALVTAQRHSEHANLEVIIGGLQDFEPEQPFDYITVIGVLEYAGTFYGGSNPYASFLTKLRSMLTPNGELILAIENKIGLKYLCGAPEDHTSRIFDSIYSYPYSSKVQTFSKKELADFFHEAGFDGLKWYYPVPDYKMPQEVLSEQITPGNLDSIWNWLPARTVGIPRKEILSEKRLGKTLAKAGLFGEFANSFLVVASREQTKENFKCLRFTGANQIRKPQYQTYFEIWQKAQEKMFIRKAETAKAEPFIREIAQREVLAGSFIAEKAQVVTGRLDDSCLYYPYINYPSLQDLIADVIETGDSGFGRFIIEDYRQFLYSLPTKTCIAHEFMSEFDIKPKIGTKPVTCLQKALLDCIPRNIKVSKGKWYIIDNEWTYDFPLPIDYLIFRGILALITDLQPQIQCAISKDKPLTVFRGYGKTRQYIPFSWLEILQKMEIPIEDMAYWEKQLQKHVWSSNKTLRVSLREKFEAITGIRQLRLRKNPRIISHVTINEIKTSPEILYEIHSALQKIKNRLLRVL
jgi:2-polyprenyl-3-methyl-5-hydroxy-6-metoxy-1,4-benzoquinol methylase